MPIGRCGQRICSNMDRAVWSGARPDSAVAGGSAPAGRPRAQLEYLLEIPGRPRHRRGFWHPSSIGPAAVGGVCHGCASWLGNDQKRRGLGIDLFATVALVGNANADMGCFGWRPVSDRLVLRWVGGADCSEAVGI